MMKACSKQAEDGCVSFALDDAMCFWIWCVVPCRFWLGKKEPNYPHCVILNTFCAVKCTQSSSLTLSDCALLWLRLAPSDVHLHPIIHNTYVKLITARGHDLANTTHKGTAPRVSEESGSLHLHWVQLCRINSCSVIIGNDEGYTNF